VLVMSRPIWLPSTTPLGCSAPRLTGCRRLTSVLTHVDVLELLEYFSSSTTIFTPAAAVRVTPLDQAGLRLNVRLYSPTF
jgi:hypothetical protein